MTRRVKTWLAVIVMLAAFFLGLPWLGEMFRRHTLPFAVLWLSAPTIALLVRRQGVAAFFTLAGLRRLHAILIAVAISISFMMFASHDQVRNQVGRAFVSGYRSWRAEPVENLDGQLSYPGDDYTASRAWGRNWIGIFELVLMTAAVVLPVITYRASGSAVSKRETECTYQDGQLVESHRHPRS